MIGLIWLPDSNSNERNLLLSVSMEGILNIWDAKTSENIKVLNCLIIKITLPMN